MATKKNTKKSKKKGGANSATEEKNDERVQSIIDNEVGCEVETVVDMFRKANPDPVKGEEAIGAFLDLVEELVPEVFDDQDEASEDDEDEDYDEDEDDEEDGYFDPEDEDDDIGD